jgi:drug/metabolite transporter (DMT)-like permease
VGQSAKPLATGTATTDRAHALSYLPVFQGVLWAWLTVAIWGAWPAFTRLSVIDALTPHDLVALRYAIGGLILLPILIKNADRIPRSGWREGVVLAICQGAPLALLVTIGVQYAPASHMGALSPGVLPLFAAILGFLFFNERLSRARIVGLALILVGALVMAGFSLSTFSSGVWRGDILFVCAGFMGSIYAVRMRRSGLSAMQGAALIGVYSMIFYLPVYCLLWIGSSGLTSASAHEVVFQALYQGVLMGAVALFSLSRAIVILGAPRAGAFLSLVPVLATVLGAIVLRELPSISETIAVAIISFGVLLAARASQQTPAPVRP